MTHERPPIVCLAGSTRFRRAYRELNRKFTLDGNIVLTICDSHFDISPEEKSFVDKLHLKKIDLADKVFFINELGYVGDTGTREIAYCIAWKKDLVFMEPDKGNLWLEDHSHKLGALVADIVIADELKASR